MEESLKKFLKKNPAPSDDQFHAWAERKGHDTDKAEAGAYRLAGKYVNLLTEGKSKGKSPKGITPEEKRVGVKIEAEHTDDLDLRKKIRNDHNTEFKRYYTHLPAFEKMLEAEKKGSAFRAQEMGLVRLKKSSAMNKLAFGFTDEMDKRAAKDEDKAPSPLKRALIGAAIGTPLGAGLALGARRFSIRSLPRIIARVTKDKGLGAEMRTMMRTMMPSVASTAAQGGVGWGGLGAAVGALQGSAAKRRFLREKGETKKD